MKTLQISGQNQVKLSNLVFVSILFIIALTEWSTWTPGSSFLRSFIPSLGTTASFWIAVGLLALALISFWSSNAIHALIGYFSFSYLANSPLVNWAPAKKSVAEAALPFLLALIATVMIIRILPEGMNDLAAMVKTVTIVFCLLFLALLLRMVVIPRMVRPVLEKGVLQVGRHTCYEVIDINGLISYTYYEAENQWKRNFDQVQIINGEQVILFDPAHQFPISDSITISNPAFEAGIDLTIRALRDNYPAVVGNNDITRLQHWFSAQAGDRKKLMEVSAAKLSTGFDRQIRAMFGISEQGQFIFDNVSKIIKTNALKAWDLIGQIECTKVERQLEETFSASTLGAAYQKKNNVYSIEVSVRSLDLKNMFQELNETMKEINTSNSKIGAELRGKVIEKLTDLYTSLCPLTDPTQIAAIIENLFSEQKTPVNITTNEQNNPLTVNGEGQLLWGEDKVQKVASDIAQLGQWIANQPDLDTKVQNDKLMNEIYFQLREKNLIQALPPGLSNASLSAAIERSMHIETGQLTDPHSRLYEDYDYRLEIAGKITKS